MVKLTDEQFTDAYARMSVFDMAEQFECSDQYVRTRAKKLGIYTKRGRFQTNPNAHTSQRGKFILHLMVDQELTNKEIDKALKEAHYGTDLSKITHARRHTTLLTWKFLADYFGVLEGSSEWETLWSLSPEI